MSGILAIADGNDTYLNLFNTYSQLSTSDITLHATTYVNAYTRQAQNNDQLYHFLKNSLTASGTAKIISKSTRYHIVINTCGYIIFKIILQKSIIDTKDKNST